MKEYPVITISRQYGSGGREVGQLLAKRLGIPYYDNELITLAAQESGFSPELSQMRTRMPPTACCSPCLFMARPPVLTICPLAIRSF